MNKQYSNETDSISSDYDSGIDVLLFFCISLEKNCTYMYFIFKIKETIKTKYERVLE